MELPKLVNDPIKGFGINRYSQEEHGTLEASPREESEPEAETGGDAIDADLLAKKGEPAESEETSLNTSGVQEGLNERVKDATKEHLDRSA